MYNEGGRHPIENGFAGTLAIIQYKSVRESSYISQYDPNEDLSENIPNKFAIVTNTTKKLHFKIQILIPLATKMQ